MEKIINKEFRSTIAVTGKEVDQLRKTSGFDKQKLISPKIGALRFVCACGRQMTADEETLKQALGIKDKNSKDQKDKVYLEGAIYEGDESPKAGDLVFLMDNSNGHNYPLATLIIFGADQKESRGLFLQNGGFRVGNNMPIDRVYKPVRIHKDLVPNIPLIKKMLEVHCVEIFGKEEKESVPRKSSRKAKTKYL